MDSDLVVEVNWVQMLVLGKVVEKAVEVLEKVVEVSEKVEVDLKMNPITPKLIAKAFFASERTLQSRLRGR